DIINTGVSGWGNDQEYLYFVHEGFRYKPDIVVLAFFIINDPADNCNSRRYGMEKPYFHLAANGLEVKNVPVPLYQPVLGKIELSSILQKSRFMNLMVTALWSYNHVLTFGQKVGLVSIAKKTEKSENQIGETCNLIAVLIIKQLSKFCKENGCGLIVMKFGRFLRELQPFAAFIDRRDVEFRKLYGLYLNDVDYLDVDAEFESQRIPIEEFLGKGGDNLHWNETGHRVAGESLAHFLLDRLK